MNIFVLKIQENGINNLLKNSDFQNLSIVVTPKPRYLYIVGQTSPRPVGAVAIDFEYTQAPKAVLEFHNRVSDVGGQSPKFQQVCNIFGH